MMRLSDAIRAGCLIKPNQAFGCLFDINRDASCAQGAAIDGAGLAMEGDWPEEWRSLVHFGGCPAAEKTGETCFFNSLAAGVLYLAEHLNDKHLWTREEIANFVQTVEDAKAGHADLVLNSEQELEAVLA